MPALLTLSTTGVVTPRRAWPYRPRLRRPASTAGFATISTAGPMAPAPYPVWSLIDERTFLRRPGAGRLRGGAGEDMERDGGRVTNIEGVGAGAQRDTGPVVGGGQRGDGQPGPLGTEHEGDATATAPGGDDVDGVGSGRRRQGHDREARLMEYRQSGRPRLGPREREVQDL